jgi:hypothetical protein
MSDPLFQWNPNLCKSEVLDYLEKHQNSDPKQRAFRPSPFEKVSRIELQQQWEGRERIRKKLPSWYSNRQALFPARLNLEQCSSERTAGYKAALIQSKLNKERATLADITGGFGVDSFAFAQKGFHVHYCERQRDLTQLVSNNARVFGLDHFQVYAQEAEAFFLQSKISFDLVYADPARRDEEQNRVFALDQTEPNLKNLLSFLPSRTPYLLLKTSPFLDIQQGLNALPQTSEVHIVSLGKEVKELLWWVPLNEEKTQPQIICAHHTKEEWTENRLAYADIARSKATYGDPVGYLYSPNPALMKSGAFNWISQEFGVKKIQKNSHLYSSPSPLDFPGKRFRISKTLSPTSKLLKKYKNQKWEVVCRNYPSRVEEIRQQFRIKAGGKSNYLIFTRDQKEQALLIEAQLDQD